MEDVEILEEGKDLKVFGPDGPGREIGVDLKSAHRTMIEYQNLTVVGNVISSPRYLSKP